MSDGLYKNGPEGGHVRGLLAAYMDGDLGGSEHERVRAHLEACGDCRAEYAGLRATQQVLASMPMVSPPRAFTLTEEMVRSRSRVGWLQRLLAPGNTPRLATGSVLSFALLLLVLFGGYFSGMRVNETFSTIGSGLSGDVSYSQFDAQPGATANRQAAELPQDSAAPAQAQAQATPGMGGAAGEQQGGEPSGLAAGAPPPEAGNAGQPSETAAASAAENDVLPTAVAADAAATTEPSTAMTGAASAPVPTVEPKLSLRTETPVVGGEGSLYSQGSDATEGGPLSSEDRSNEQRGDFSPLLAIEVLLGVLGVALAAAAVASRRGQ